MRPLHDEGAAESGWVLLDYGDVLMHVFLEETRGYYALERLWGDAPSIPVDGCVMRVLHPRGSRTLAATPRQSPGRS